MDNRLNNIFIATFSGNAEKTAKKYGFGLELNDLCISSNLEPEKREWVINRMKRELEEADAVDRKTIMHGPFTELTPSSIDPRAIALMRDRYIETIEICRELNIRDLVLHDGYIPLLYQKPWHLKRSISFWREFAEELPDGFRVYIENVFDDEPELLLEIIETVNHKIGMPKGEEKYLACLDIGHANAMLGGEKKRGEEKDSTSEIENWIRRFGALVGHYHLHNNDGTGDNHDDIDKGTIEIERILKAIESYSPPDVTMTIESRDAEPSAEYLYKFYSR